MLLSPFPLFAPVHTPSTDLHPRRRTDSARRPKTEARCVRPKDRWLSRVAPEETLATSIIDKEISVAVPVDWTDWFALIVRRDSGKELNRFSIGPWSNSPQPLNQRPSTDRTLPQGPIAMEQASVKRSL